MDEEKKSQDVVLRRLATIEDRLGGLESMLLATQESINAAVDVLSNSSREHRQSIKNLSERMTHESLSIFEFLNEMRDKLDPAYDRVFPAFQHFVDDVDRVFQGKPRPTTDD